MHLAVFEVVEGAGAGVSATAGATVGSVAVSTSSTTSAAGLATVDGAVAITMAAAWPLRRSMGGVSGYLQQVEGGSPRVDITPLDVTQPR